MIFVKNRTNIDVDMLWLRTANNEIKIILVSMMQGGGFEKLQLDIAPSISSTVPMEAIIFKAEHQLFTKRVKRNSFSPQCNPGNQHAV